MASPLEPRQESLTSLGNSAEPAMSIALNRENVEAFVTQFIQIRFTRALAISTMFAATAYVTIPAAQAKTNFDGNWSVVIITEKGTCDRSYRYPVRITDGTVGYAGEASFKISGRVNANGAVTVTVSRGDQRASGSGKLSGTSGGGSWFGGDCSGTWQAERRS
jgi:hypothetical protein